MNKKKIQYHFIILIIPQKDPGHITKHQILTRKNKYFSQNFLSKQCVTQGAKEETRIYAAIKCLPTEIISITNQDKDHCEQPGQCFCWRTQCSILNNYRGEFYNGVMWFVLSREMLHKVPGHPWARWGTNQPLLSGQDTAGMQKAPGRPRAQGPAPKIKGFAVRSCAPQSLKSAHCKVHQLS